MTLIIETGSGVRMANSYVPISYVTNYLTFRDRLTENSWSTRPIAIQEAAIIQATDYIEKKFGSRFRGYKKFFFDEVLATATVSFSGNPSNGQILTINDESFTFVSALSSGNFEVLIGATNLATAANLVASLNAQSAHTTAVAVGAVVTLTATASGASGNYTLFTSNLVNTTITQFIGGKDGGLQVLSWPRIDIYSENGNLITGIPDKLKQAISEYSVRALSSALLPDPDNITGRIKSKLEKVGPIEEETHYWSGGVISPYPAADKLLSEFLLSTRGVERG